MCNGRIRNISLLEKLLEPPRAQRTPRKIQGKVENLAKSHPKHKQVAGRL